jgi:hypothetical protein
MNDISHVAFFVPVRVRMDVLTEKKNNNTWSQPPQVISVMYIYIFAKR